MTNNDKENIDLTRKVPWVAHLFVSVIILVVTIFIVVTMFSNKPVAKRWGGEQSSPTVAVDVVDINAQDYQVWVDSYGTAQPLTQTVLVADVSARVIEVSSKIRTGSAFSKGDVLVKLDDRDFRIDVEIAKSDVAQARVLYLQETAEAELAAQQWNKQPKGEAAKLLALRKPQVTAAEASLKAAEARLKRAELNLSRTTITAPFDGMILSQSVDIGQVVSPNQVIATIYSTDTIEVRLPVKITELEYLDIVQERLAQQQPNVYLTGDFGAKTYVWNGKIVRSEGAFDPTTRTLFLVAQVEAPFVATELRPALRVGQFLNAQIKGQLLSNVFVIPRQAVSQNNEVSVVDNGVLRKRVVESVWTDQKNIIVSAAPISSEASVGSGIRLGDKVILTPTANIPDGTKVRTLEDSLPETSTSSAQKALQANANKM